MENLYEEAARNIGESYIGIDINSLYKKAQENFAKEFEKLGHINLVLTGRSGVGKSTLVNVMFGADITKEGTGLPETQTTDCFDIPDLPLRLYDTKGLELGADAQRQSILDIKQIVETHLLSPDEDQRIHAIWYCINAGTNRIEPAEIDWIRELGSIGEVEIIVVLTQCFRKKQAERLLEVIKEQVGNNIHSCVMVLAKADPDEPEKPSFGLDDLLEATRSAIPKDRIAALIHAQKVDIRIKEKKTRKCIWKFAGAAVGGVALNSVNPIPMSDAGVLVTNEIAMCARLTAVFGYKISKNYIAEIVMAMLGVSAATIGGRAAVTSALKLWPGAGTLLSAIIGGTTAAALTTALGHSYVSVLVLLASGKIKPDEIGTDSFKKQVQGIFKDALGRKKFDEDYSFLDK